MSTLQKEFFRQNSEAFNPTAPFLEIKDDEVERIMEQAKQRSER
jgi:penicillin-binding protein 1A